MTAERKAWIRAAQSAGVSVGRGESLDAIKAKIQKADEGSYKIITGVDAPSRRKCS